MVANWLVTECFNADKPVSVNEDAALACASHVYAAGLAPRGNLRCKPAPVALQAGKDRHSAFTEAQQWLDHVQPE